MPSTINRTLPAQNSPMLSNEMRQQFGRAADDIDALQTGKANLAGPVFTGTPQAPTAGAGTNSTQIATTSFVRNNATTNLQGNPVAAGTPTANQVLQWSGTTWAAATATGGVPDPATLAFRPLPSDLHNWLPLNTAGYFTAFWPGSPSLSNAPPGGGGEWIFQGYGRVTGEQVIIARRPFPHFVDEPEYVKRRVTWSGGTWHPWQANPGRMWVTVRSRVISNFTITATPQMLPDFNLPYRPASRRHIYHFNSPLAYSGWRLHEWDAAYIPPGDGATLTGNVVDLNSNSVDGNTARLVIDQNLGYVDVAAFAADDWEGMSRVLGNHLIYISRPSGSQTYELGVTVMALIENLINVR